MNRFECGRPRWQGWWVALALAIPGPSDAGETALSECRPFQEVRVEPVGVSIKAKAALLKDLLSDLCRKAGIRCTGDPALAGLVDVCFENMPLEKALIRLLGDETYVIIWAYDFNARKPRDICRPVAVWVGPREGYRPIFSQSPLPQAEDDNIPFLNELASRLLDAGSTSGVLKAAQTLAKIGSPEAVRPLFEAVEKLPDGDLREDLIRIAGGITNDAALPVLSDVWLGAGRNPGVTRAAEPALARLVDGERLRQLRDACERSGAPDDFQRFLDLLRQVSSPAAEDILKKWTGEKTGAPATVLESAARTALSRIGTASAANRLIARADPVADENVASVHESFRPVAPVP